MLNEARLLTSYEVLTVTPEQIKESRELNGGKMVLKGIIQRADALNQNGRIYSRDILTREIRNYQKFILENRATGELDHPESSVISLQKVSHVMRKAEMKDDGTVYGELEVLDTPCGKIAQSLVESGVKIGISSRGVGSVKEQDQYLYVQEDFQLICFDLVQDPSTINAFLHENRRVDQNDLRKIFTKSDRISRIANEIISSH